jgi:23S rRNA (guanosine2251-2'-O)-methyltransferase
LGAERNVPIAYQADIKETLSGIKAANFTLLALEQAKNSIDVFTYERPDGSIALIVGPEVSGITPAVLELCDGILEIPMYGRKESLNVSVAAGIALYQLRR